MMADTMARSQGRETVTAEHVRELREEPLNLGRSREVGSRLRGWRGVENNRLRALRLHNLASFDVNEKIKPRNQLRIEGLKQVQAETSRCKLWNQLHKRIKEE